MSFLKEYSVIKAEDELIVSSSGSSLRWLLDTRIALLNPEMSFAIAALFWDYIERLYPFQMCCLELTGIPLMMGIQGYAMRRGYSVNAFVIRKERKATGRQRQLEGTVNDLPIIFLDDILNSGDSIERAIVAMSKHNRQIVHVVALVDFGTSVTGERLLRQGINLKSLIALEELGVSKSPRTSDDNIASQIFREIWKFDQGNKRSFDIVPKSIPALDEGRVYFGTDSGHFYALNRITGEIEWTFLAGSSNSKGIRSSPAIEGDLVYFGGYDGSLYAVEKDTGRLRWQFMEADWIGSSPCIARRLNSLYVGLEYALSGQRGSLVALDLKQGERKWEFQIASLVHSSPLFIEEHRAVVIGSNGGAIYCVDALTGELRWTFQTEGAIKSRACYDSITRLVIAGSFDKCVYAWSVETGELEWKVGTDGPIYSEPLVVVDEVYVCSTDKHLYTLKIKDGAQVSRFFAGAKLFSSPNVYRDRIYCASTSGAVYEVDSVTHAMTGIHVIPERITNKIICDGQTNQFYVSTNDGQLIAFERS